MSSSKGGVNLMMTNVGRKEGEAESKDDFIT